MRCAVGTCLHAAVFLLPGESLQRGVEVPRALWTRCDRVSAGLAEN